MSFRSRKTGKCCQCCPSGGAIFHKDLDDNNNWVWKCQNCHATKPIRKSVELNAPSVGMQKIINQMSSAFGGACKVVMIGRKAFVTLENDQRSAFNGRIASGVVCANGRFSINLYRIGGDFKVTKQWHIESYFARYNPELKEGGE